MKHFKNLLLLTGLVLLTSCKTADIQRVANVLNAGNQQLSQETVVAGLKQALQVGTERTVLNTNRTGGFSNNSLIKIIVPEKLEKVASTVRKVGLGSYVDKFELQMNRAAESASGQAKDVFVDAISGMSLQDAWGILRGGDNAATNYFRQKTEANLRSKFAPIITDNMKKVGFYNDYQKLLGTYNKLPLTKKPNLNIEDYVMTETLDGLFTLVAEEEAQIRNNPLARTTELLQKVFSQQ